MDIQQIVELDDGTFKRYALRAVKNRIEHPDWWRAFLSAEVIDATEEVVSAAVAEAKRQADGGYRKATGFYLKGLEALDEIALERIVRAQP